MLKTLTLSKPSKSLKSWSFQGASPPVPPSKAVPGAHQGALAAPWTPSKSFNISPPPAPPSPTRNPGYAPALEEVKFK
ncbi:hypothetical protein DPMN_179070 [Dreissena polymorpha]|uniref:Uncharacterized protein n=1 Tax=Dreissena polymorpha TaxID=45954 RepID=A0A9D4IM07_DREPO|nr:hypothetical protein DPMN_179070 [Dreissena polymorpha]